jgi:hypothetical protein
LAVSAAMHAFSRSIFLRTSTSLSSCRAEKGREVGHVQCVSRRHGRRVGNAAPKLVPVHSSCPTFAAGPPTPSGALFKESAEDQYWPWPGPYNDDMTWRPATHRSSPCQAAQCWLHCAGTALPAAQKSRTMRRQHKALAIHPARAPPTLAPHISGAAYCEVRGLEEGGL